MVQPVPGRVCGGCTVCCKELMINEPELKKPSGVLCTHCAPGQGCQIHANWPRLCREWFCGWRYMPQLDESWRPDRCGILVEVKGEEMDRSQLPEAFRQAEFALKFTLFGARPNIGWRPLVNIVSVLISKGIPVLLATAGKPGYAAGQIFLNNNLRAAVATRDFAAISGALAQAFKQCADRPQEKLELP